MYTKSHPIIQARYIRAHESVLACLRLLACLLNTYRLPLNSPKALDQSCAVHSLSLSKQVPCALFAMRICTYAYQFHLCII